MTMKEKSDEMEWSAEEEIQLLSALVGLKPVGLNKHFYMACIAERLSDSLSREVPSEAIWAHLRTMYNLEALDEMKPLPFPNEQTEFSLPDNEFTSLITQKIAETENKKSENKEKSASGRQSLPAKELEKKVAVKLAEPQKRAPKRTRGSLSLESNSPSTTPPPTQAQKRRRI